MCIYKIYINLKNNIFIKNKEPYLYDTCVYWTHVNILYICIWYCVHIHVHIYIYMDILHACNVNVNTYIYECNMCELSIYIIYNLYIYTYMCQCIAQYLPHQWDTPWRVSLPRYTSNKAQSKRECRAPWDGNHWPQTSQLTWHWPCVCLHSIGPAEIKLRQTQTQTTIICCNMQRHVNQTHPQSARKSSKNNGVITIFSQARLAPRSETIFSSLQYGDIRWL